MKFMPKFSERGIIQVVILLLLLGGMAVGLYLVQQTQIFKPKASSSGTRIEVVDPSGNPISDTNSPNVKVKLAYTPPAATPASNNPYKIGAFYFGMWSTTDTLRSLLSTSEQVYGRKDMWAGVKDFYGQEPGIRKDTREWEGDFSYLKPQIGYYDFSQNGASVLEQHINQAKQAGLSFFNFYWYWDSTSRSEVYNDGLESLLQARNKNDIQFMISVTSHPWGDGDIKLSMPNQDLEKIVQIIIDKYLSQSNYLKTSEGRPIIFILDSRAIKDGSLDDNHEFIALLKQRAKTKIGVEPFVLINVDLSFAKSVLNADGYSCVVGYMPSFGAQSYQGYLDSLTSKFSEFSNKPLMPCFIANFDERPRQDILVTNRSDIRYFNDYTDAYFKQGLVKAKQYMDNQSSEIGKMMVIYAWNEWHEGGIIEPNIRDGNARLRVITSVFNLKSAESETTYPSSFRLANSENELTNATEQQFTSGSITTDWILAEGDGEKTVYAQFKVNDSWGPVYHAKITINSSSTPTPSASTQSNTTPVYRLVNQKGNYLYAVSEQEKNNAESEGFHLEGIAFQAFEQASSDTVSVYRLKNNDSGDYFYTLSKEELNSAKGIGYTAGGTAFYAFSSPTSTSVPVYRLVSGSGNHFYTAGEEEKSQAIKNFGFTLEGVAFYVPK